MVFYNSIAALRSFILNYNFFFLISMRIAVSLRQKEENNINDQTKYFMRLDWIWIYGMENSFHRILLLNRQLWPWSIRVLRMKNKPIFQINAYNIHGKEKKIHTSSENDEKKIGSKQIPIIMIIIAIIK